MRRILVVTLVVGLAVTAVAFISFLYLRYTGVKPAGPRFALRAAAPRAAAPGGAQKATGPATPVAPGAGVAVPPSPGGDYDKLMPKVQAAIARGDLKEAERLLEGLSLSYPKNAEVLSMRGRVLFWEKRYPESFSLYRQALSLKPDDTLRREALEVEAALTLAEVDRLLEKKEEGRAIEELTTLFTSGKERYRSGLLLSRLLLARGQNRRAAGVLERLRTEFPSDWEIASLYAQALLGEGEPEQAALFLEGYAAVADHAELLALKGRALFRLKRYLDARDSFRRSLALGEDPEVRREFNQTETAGILEQSDRFIAAGLPEKAESLLVPLFASGRGRYDAGIRLARIQIDAGKDEEAAALYSALIADHPDSSQNAELFELKGAALFRLKRYPEAIEFFDRSLAIADSTEVRQARDQAQLAVAFQEVDRLQANGKSKEAILLLTPLFESGRARYDAGIRLGRIYTRAGNHLMGARIYASLMKLYPQESDFRIAYAASLVNLGESDLALDALDKIKGEDARVYGLRAQIYFLRHDYLLARQEYGKALRISKDPDLVKGKEEVEEALAFEEAQKLVAAGSYRQAQEILAPLAEAGGYRYESRLLLGRTYLAQRDYDRAVPHYRKLLAEYPNSPDVAAMSVESYILAGKPSQGGDLLYSLNAKTAEVLKTDREDLFYRVNTNWLKVGGAGYGYSNGTREEDFSVSVSQRFKRATLVATGSAIHRFGTTDEQVGADLYLGGGERSPIWGMVSFAASPGSHFLPRTTEGFEVAGGWRNFELSGGYNRLDFAQTGVNVVTAGVLWYIPATTLSLAEKLYLVPENGTAMSVTTLNWEPSHRLRSYLLFGAGNSSERVTTAQDLNRYTTFSGTLGGEYRFDTRLSVGAEGGYESRRGLYDRSGALLYGRYWWR